MWIYREISDRIKDVVATYPAILLTGARQVGKTSLLQKLYPNYSFVTLDLPSNASIAENNPDEFLERYPPPVIIDEIQYAPKLFRYLKIYIDKNRKKYGQFILTGSQKFTLMENVSDSLAGRCAILELDALGYSEILSVKAVSEVESIVEGGFPEIQSRPELNRNIFYQSYLSTYLERDVRTILNVGQLRDFERFIRACALRNAQMLNKAELARDVGISPTTANEWLSVLQSSNQIILLEPWFNNKTKSLSKSPKLYLAEVGFLCYLLGIDTVNDLAKSPLKGAVWETFVLSELRKKQFLKNGKIDIWMWRDNRMLEVDFLIHKGGIFNLFEAKYSEHPSNRDADNIIKVSSILGEKNVENKVIVCRAKQTYPLFDDIEAVPVTDISEYI